MIQTLRLDIILGSGRFYGTLRVKNLGGNIIAIDNNELKKEIEKRLPYLRTHDYMIRF